MIDIPAHQRANIDKRFEAMCMGELHPGSPGDKFFNSSKPSGEVPASQLGLYALTDRPDTAVSDWTTAYGAAEKKFLNN